MNESTWGVRDARGEWRPDDLPVPSPLFTWPWRPKAILKYLFGPVGFLWPYNLAVAILAVLGWLLFSPTLAQAATFRIWWIAEIYARNAVLAILVFGGLHLRLYATRGQGMKFKYSDKWMAKDDGRFLFRNQTWDNIFWTMVSGVTIWTAWEAMTFWLYAHKIIPYAGIREHPVWFVLMFIVVILFRQVHFYFVHRLIHWKPLFKISHYLHHKNINIGPWSGMSMHPLEHLLYLSGVILSWFVPSHPIHAIFQLMHAGLTPALGHTGFHRLTGKGERGLEDNNYFHYLHHRFFTVNYGNEAVPLDKWFGTFYDGSPEAHAKMIVGRHKEAG